jgi:hypothetical protein
MSRILGETEMEERQQEGIGGGRLWLRYDK